MRASGEKSTVKIFRFTIETPYPGLVFAFMGLVLLLLAPHAGGGVGRGDTPPAARDYQEHVGQICDELDGIASAKAKSYKDKSPTGLLTAYKRYETAYGDFAQLTPPAALRSKAEAAEAL